MNSVYDIICSLFRKSSNGVTHSGSRIASLYREKRYDLSLHQTINYLGTLLPLLRQISVVDLNRGIDDVGQCRNALGEEIGFIYIYQ